MARERSLNNRTRRAEKVRGEVIRQSESSVTSTVLQQDNLPKHLQPLKENYEVSIVADEVQKQKRVRGQHTIGIMTTATREVALDINDDEVEAIERINAQPMRTSQRIRVAKAMDDISDIAYRALKDGLEEGAIRVNEIADSDPRAQKIADTSIEIDDLTLKEKLTGRVRRSQ